MWTAKYIQQKVNQNSLITAEFVIHFVFFCILNLSCRNIQRCDIPCDVPNACLQKWKVLYTLVFCNFIYLLFFFLCGHGALTMEKEQLKNSYHRFSVTLHAFLVLFTSNIVSTFMKGRTQIFVWIIIILLLLIIIIIIIVCRITIELT